MSPTPSRRQAPARKKPEQPRISAIPVRVREDVHTGLKRLKLETGIPASKIAEMAWITAIERWEKGLPPIAKSGVETNQRAIVPLLGEVCAGDGINVTPIEGQSVQLPEGIRGGTSRYCLRIKGDSMDGVGGHSIVDNMIAVFDKDKPAYPNCVAHIEWNEKGVQICTVKKLKYREGEKRLILYPTNPRYEAKTVKKDDVEIRGVLVTGVPSEEAVIIDVSLRAF